MKYAFLLLALMFVGVATPSMAQKLTFEFNGETVEVAKKDFPNRMNWGAAKKACKNLGNGWRLPSIDELEAMNEQLHTEGRGNFSAADWYWSGSEYDANVAWYFSFEYGKFTDHNNKRSTVRVRAVRTLP